MGQLKKSQLKGRSVTYRFLQKGRKNPVWKVQAIRANFQLTTRHRMRTYFRLAKITNDAFERFSEVEVAWEFILDTEGRVVYEKTFNNKGNMLWGLVYSPPLTGLTTHAHYVGADGYPCSKFHTDAEFIEIIYSSQGDEISTRYFDRQHQPRVRSGSVHQINEKFNGDGLFIETIHFDINGQPTQNENGNHIETYHCDFKGNFTSMSCFKLLGESICFRYSDKIVYDSKDNEIEYGCFGLEGEPILSENGVHKWTVEYDVEGNTIGCAYFGLEGEPVLRNKEGVHKWSAQYDTQGNSIEYTYFGLEGEPVFRMDRGIHKSFYQYDARGNQTECAYFGLKGEPILDEDGVHKSTAQYDTRGNQTEWAYFGLKSEPILHKDGMHKWTAQYDARCNQTEWAYFGLKSEPILHGKEGVHKWTAQYTSQGKLIECIHLGLDGEPILDKDGVHKWTTSYDNQGNAIERNYFDTQGQTIRTQLTVISVNDNSSLEVNDIILSYDNQILTNKVIYRNLKAKTTTPAKELQILRAGNPLSLLIKLKELDVELEDIAC